MSATADAVTVLAPAGGRRATSLDRSAARPAVRLLAFAGLATYGALRWSVLLTPAPFWRLLGLLGLGVIAAAVPGALARHGAAGRTPAILAGLVIVLAALLVVGVPTQLLLHGHLGAVASGIDQGLSALPRVTVPYDGIDAWVRIVILLGAAVLLLDAGFLLALVSGSLGDARRAGAALPLLALAVVPSTLMRPAAPYLHGLLLFVLIGALLWGERLPAGRTISACLACAAAGLVALTIAPALDPHRAWVNYESLAGAFSPSRVETFDWTQRYGPLDWPRTGREMIDVQAPRGDYWKAENLDTFNGIGWVSGAVETSNTLPSPDPVLQARWSERLRVTVRGMQTTDLVAAGFATAPAHTPTAVTTGSSPGTWIATVDLGPGDSYEVDAYSPRPSTRELASIRSIGSDADTSGYRSLLLPASIAQYAQPEVVFPPFHSDLPPVPSRGSALVSSSPYGGAYALAQRLARHTSTPIAFIQSVERYLARGFTYDENPPRRQYPLESFLFGDRRGYCQQFSGAMAMLLRMGGIPARVSAGFTSGTYDQTMHQWTVTDLDAHAWVEAWFPGYGWVRFDPTPTAAPALAGGAAAAALAANAKRSSSRPAQTAHRPEPGGSTSPGRHRSHGGSSMLLALIPVTLVCALVIAVLFVTRRRRAPSVEQLVAELERALVRCGRPLPPRATLAQLERRFRSAPEAAAYIRALRLSRYAAAEQAPGLEGRGALRARLADGLGWAGRVRAIWALPPRLR